MKCLSNPLSKYHKNVKRLLIHHFVSFVKSQLLHRRVNPSRFQVFIDVCERFHESGDSTYDYIYGIIKVKTSVELDEEKFVFHLSSCRHTFQRIPSNFKREPTTGHRLSKAQEGEGLVFPIERIPRQQAASFNKNLCLCLPRFVRRSFAQRRTKFHGCEIKGGFS